MFNIFFFFLSLVNVCADKYYFIVENVRLLKKSQSLKVTVCVCVCVQNMHYAMFLFLSLFLPPSINFWFVFIYPSGSNFTSFDGVISFLLWHMQTYNRINSNRKT